MKREKKILFNILIIILCLSIGPLLFGQVNIEWSKSIDVFNDCAGFDVEQTTDGGYIVVGSVFLGNSHEIWLLKTDLDGNIVWSNTFGRGGYDGGRNVQQTIDGGYIVAGGDNDLWLIKTDANGDTLWTRTYMDPSWPSVLEQTTDGGFIIIGEKLLKTDGNGDSLWTKTYDGRGQAIEQTTDGEYIITGGIWSDTVSWDQDVWLIKTDSNGDTLWTRIYGGSGSDCGNFVQQTLDGGYIVAAGRDWNHMDFSHGFLLKIDSSGNTQWTRSDSLYSSGIVNELADGNFLVLGDSYESDGYNICLTKIDIYGNKIWTKVSEQEGGGGFTGGEPTNDDGFILTGIIDDSGMNGKLWLVKVADNVTSKNEETEGVHFSVHPNPTNTLINIGIDHPDRYSIYLYSSNGRLIYSERSEESNHQIDLSSFQKGLYFITIRSRDFVTTRKIIKL